MAYTTEDMLEKKLKERAGTEKEEEVDAMEFGVIKNDVLACLLACFFTLRMSFRVLIEVMYVQYEIVRRG